MAQNPVIMDTIVIAPYMDAAHRRQVIELWTATLGYASAHNAPELALDRKIAVDDGLFFVALAGDTVIGTVMAGYDGHRGWIYSVAVALDRQKRGLGTKLVAHAESALTQRGCVKINLQIAEGNEAVTAFYESLGYAVENRVSMGKKIPANIPGGA